MVAPCPDGLLSLMTRSSACSEKGLFTLLWVTGGELDRRAVEPDVAVTGALQYAWAPESRFTPYVTFGGGVGSSGESPVDGIGGSYSVRILNQVPIIEQDNVDVLSSTIRLTAVVGGGVRTLSGDGVVV